MDNKREFFRVDLHQYNVTVLPKDGDEKKYRFDGKIRDISGNGISFYLNKDLDFKEASLRFMIEHEVFNFNTRLIRKDKITSGQVIYACVFQEELEKNKARLSSLLLKIQGQRLKKDE